MPLKDAENYPELIEIVRTKVKPFRDKLKRKVYRERWWQFGEKQTALYDALQGMDRALCISRVRATGFTFLPSDTVFSEQLVVFPLPSQQAFAILQSRMHEVWAHFFSGSALDLIRYTPSDCFETFPFPLDWEENAALEEAGKSYYEYRAELMVRNDEGLTKTYNRFHDPEERSPDILSLRELHAAMDRAVLDAYGWTDLPTACQFLLDYEEDEEEPEPGKKPRKKKKPWRYRWPDEIRDEVLARLLALNAERHAQEVALGIAPGMKKAKTKAPKKKKARDKLDDGQPTLL